ncbi:MAG: homocysteine S-methyltransferase family protein [Bacteroidales bacterium]|nr:MAG: homocysteine S-methyltransferase family protein [Bacteroidales bacterium]
MIKLLEENDLILMEGAVNERLRRSDDIELHPVLVSAPLIYDVNGGRKLSEIYNSYIEVAKDTDFPFLMCAPTWRTNYLRVTESGINRNINIDAVNFMKEIRKSHGTFSHKIKIGGIIGCKNDCYKPEEGLSKKESESFHSWQADQLAEAGVDFIIAETIPNINEASGMAKSFEKTGLPYIIGFVISRDGLILDGTKLIDAISIIDEGVTNQPVGYFIVCSHPSFLCAEIQPQGLFNRLIGYLGNASSLDHCELDGAETLKTDSVSDWGEQMLKLNRLFGIKILGGCCGTNVEHIRYLIEN